MSTNDFPSTSSDVPADTAKVAELVALVTREVLEFVNKSIGGTVPPEILVAALRSAASTIDETINANHGADLRAAIIRKFRF